LKPCKQEYLRDVAAGKNPQIPQHYFPGDDPSKEPVCTWRASANLLFANWLNYFVYQKTPYQAEEIEREEIDVGVAR
jgi:homoserine O-succinyltransferase